ncbi:MAG: hypothetical protein ACLPLR_15360 [Terriglobales bacterium]
MTSSASRIKIAPTQGYNADSRSHDGTIAKFMTPSQPSGPPPQKVTPEQCKHPRVRIVSRIVDDEDEAEYVECLECGDVFESSEFQDMEIEAKKESDEA